MTLENGDHFSENQQVTVYCYVVKHTYWPQFVCFLLNTLLCVPVYCSCWASGPDNWILTSVAEVHGVWNLATNYHGRYFLSFLQTSSLLQALIQAGLAPDCV